MTRHSYYKTGKRDANEKEINKILLARGVRWTDLKPGDGADKIIWIQPMEIWEIKNPDVRPSDRKLTDAEKIALEYCTRMKIAFCVIETQEDAVNRLNLYFDRM